jgi:hypothetical protein
MLVMRGALITTGGIWLWAVAVAPADGRALLAWSLGIIALLLCVAVARAGSRSPIRERASVLSKDDLKLSHTHGLSVDRADQLAAIASGIQSRSHGARPSSSATAAVGCGRP